MKNSVLVFLFVLFVGVMQSFAQETPRVDERQQAQRGRIRQGAASGELTRSETRRLRAEQRHIRRSERRAKADGVVTSRERAKLQQKQNRASRDIRRQKHDRQDRPN